MPMPRWGLMLLVLACVIQMLCANAWAQSYPNKVVRLIVAVSAGSGTDRL